MSERFDFYSDDRIYAIRFPDGSYCTNGGGRGPIEEAMIFTPSEAGRKIQRMDWDATVEDIA